MRVFLTGATGFIGSHLTRLLVREGCQVSVLIRPSSRLDRIKDLLPQVSLIEGDLFASGRLEKQLQSAGPELCFHLAWYAVPGKYLQAIENLDCVTGSLELLRVLDRIGCSRTVMTGTCFEYDTEVGYLSEDTITRPRSLYAASKLALYLMAEQFQKEKSKTLAWARLFYQYGPGEDERRLVPHIIRCLLADEPCPLTSGKQIRDFLHVEDVVSALWAVGKSSLEGTVNIGSGIPLSIESLAREIAGLLKRTDLLRLGAVRQAVSDPAFICANNGRLKTTGWTPRHSLVDGLNDTLENWHQ